MHTKSTVYIFPHDFQFIFRPQYKYDHNSEPNGRFSQPENLWISHTKCWPASGRDLKRSKYLNWSKEEDLFSNPFWNFTVWSVGIIWGRYILLTQLLLGRHPACQPLDPTLDISSDFVKKKKKKHSASFFLSPSLLH